MWSHVFRHYGACSYYSALANGNTAQNSAAGTQGGTLFHHGFYYVPVGLRLQRAVFVRSAGKLVVDEGYVVAYKHIILNVHPFTNEAVTGYLAVLTYESAFLYLYKRTYFGTVVYRAAVGVYEVEDTYVFAYGYVIQALLVIIYGNRFHRLLLILGVYTLKG